MTTAGWIFMISSITFVASLISFCYYRVLTNSQRRCRSCGEINPSRAGFCPECGAPLSRT